MYKLDTDEQLTEILTDLGSTLFCMGQDWKKGDGSESQVEVKVAQAHRRLKLLVLRGNIAELRKLLDDPGLPPDCPKNCKDRHWHYVTHTMIEHRIKNLQAEIKTLEGIEES